MTGNYFLIDGSSLLSQIRTLQKNRRDYVDRKLDPIRFIYYFFNLEDLGIEEFKRAVFYFPCGDKTHESSLEMPSLKEPGLVRDINFKYCGEKLKNSEAFNNFLETVPKKWLDRCSKSEKGIDIEICCDAFKLAFTGKMERLFLFTNDRDFIPLCRTLKDFGVNVSLIHLSSTTNVNKLLVAECDTYDVVEESELQNMFIPELATLVVEPLQNKEDAAVD